jgi:hypothetical protein
VLGKHSIVLEAADGVIAKSAWWRMSIALSLDLGDPGATVQGGTVRFRPFLAHLTALSFWQGVFNHEVFLGEFDVVWRPKRSADHVDYVLKPAGYRLTVELGKLSLHADAGLSTGKVYLHGENQWRVGYVASGGLSWSFTASGGGNWHGQGR